MKKEIKPADVLVNVQRLDAEIKAMRTINKEVTQRFSTLTSLIIFLEVINVLIHFFF